MIDRNLPLSVSAFARAVGWGSLAAAAPFLLISIPLGIGTLFSGNSGDGWWTGFFVIVLPLLVAIPTVLVCSIVIGLALTALLARTGREKGQFYVTAGLLCGSAPFLMAMLWPDGSAIGMLAFAGGLGGSVTGRVWGRHRDELAASRVPD